MAAGVPSDYSHSPGEGRKSLYFDPGKILLVGIADEESRRADRRVERAMVVPDAEYHHVWHKGDIVIWATVARIIGALAPTRPRKTASIGVLDQRLWGRGARAAE